MIKKRIRNPDLMGKLFGYWTVIAEDKPNIYGKRVVVAKCRCGTVKSILAQNILAGVSHSCGCYHKERASAWSKEYQRKQREQNGTA